MNRIQQYLYDILKAVSRIQTYTNEGEEYFHDDSKTQDAVIRNFEVIGEVVKRIPKEMLAKYPEVPWQDVSGFRDVLIHDYDMVDLYEVWWVVEHDLPTLRKAIEALLAHLTAEDVE